MIKALSQFSKSVIWLNCIAVQAVLPARLIFTVARRLHEDQPCRQQLQLQTFLRHLWIIIETQSFQLTGWHLYSWLLGAPGWLDGAPVLLDGDAGLLASAAILLDSAVAWLEGSAGWLDGGAGCPALCAGLPAGWHLQLAQPLHTGRRCNLSCQLAGSLIFEGAIKVPFNLM